MSHQPYLQRAKILLLPPKYEIIMLPSHHSFFQYCDSNIGLFSIAPHLVIASHIVIALPTIATAIVFALYVLKGVSKKLQ
jgi:hypothetical protein